MNAQNQIVEMISQAGAKFVDIAPEMNAIKEQGFAMQCLNNNDYLMKAALSNPDSLKRAVINVASIGLSLNPAEKLAYLIPRSVKDSNKQWQTKIFLEPSYMGLCKLATDSGTIEWIQAKPVYSNDDFIDNGAGERPTHKYQAFKDRGEFQGVFCVAKLKSGDYLVEIMSAEEVNDIRGRSESFKKNYGPWISDYIEQAKKTVVRRAYKMWPRSSGMDRLAMAVDMSNENEGFEPIQSAPSITKASAEQKSYFDKLIETNDSLGMYILRDSIIGSDLSGPEFLLGGI